MEKRLSIIIVLAGFLLSACNTPKPSADQTAKEEVANKPENSMKNVVSIVEIAVVDLPRAIKFYQTVLNVEIQEVEMGDTQMGIIPNEPGSVNVVLVKGSDYVPSMQGTVIYLNAGEDLQPVLDRVSAAGGEVLVPKTEISPEMGYFALFTDVEGNKMGLHSAK